MNSKPMGNKKYIFTALSIIIALLIWQFVSSSDAGAVIASPADVFKSFIKEITNGKLLHHIAISLFRVLSGFALAFIVSIPIAFLMGWYQPIQLLIEPIIQFLRNIPALAYIPLVVVAQGVGESAKITVIFISTFLVMIITVYQGVKEVDSTLIKAARVLGAKDKDIFLKVVIPASVPYILVGMRLGLGASLTTLIAAELTGSNAGLGQMIQEASLYFRMDIVMLGIILIGITGLVLNLIVSIIENRVTVWQEISNVSKIYKGTNKDVHALDNVNLDIYKNEFVCVIGSSGCGKSTLLNILAGLDIPNSGTIEIDGKAIEGTGVDRGVVFQQYALFPWLTVAKNVAFGLELQKKSKDEINKIVDHYLKAVGLIDFKNSYPKELSGGMKQRVAIARAYAVNPNILLMDEPFGALDAQTRAQLQTELLNTWDNEKKTCFFITHDVDEAVFLAQRVVIMSPRPGRIKAIVEVPISYPRVPETKLSKEFNDIKKELWQLVYQEYLEKKK